MSSLHVVLRYQGLYQIACGMDYLHKKTILHGDLKSANVLVHGDEEDWIFKLCDMGPAHMAMTTKLTNSTTSKSCSKNRRGTVSFEAPEVIIDKMSS